MDPRLDTVEKRVKCLCETMTRVGLLNIAESMQIIIPSGTKKEDVAKIIAQHEPQEIMLPSIFNGSENKQRSFSGGSVSSGASVGTVRRNSPHADPFIQPAAAHGMAGSLENLNRTPVHNQNDPIAPDEHRDNFSLSELGNDELQEQRVNWRVVDETHSETGSLRNFLSAPRDVRSYDRQPGATQYAARENRPSRGESLHFTPDSLEYNRPAPESGDMLHAMQRQFELQQRSFEQQIAQQQQLIERLIQTTESALSSRTQSPNPVNISAPMRKIQGLSKLTKEDDIVCWLAAFETIMSTYNIPQSEWAQYLYPQLTGKAQTAFWQLDRGDQNNYERARVAILQQYGATPELYRQKFFTETRQAKQSYVDFMSRLVLFFKRWNSISEDEWSVESTRRLAERQIISQFIAQLSDDTLVRELRKEKDKSPRDVAQLADDFRATVNENHRQERTSNAWVAGRPWQKKQYFNNFRSDDQKDNMQNRSSVQQAAYPAQGQKDTQKRRFAQPQQGSMFCYTCGRPGHTKKYCRQSAGKRTSAVTTAHTVQQQPPGRASEEATSRQSSSNNAKVFNEKPMASSGNEEFCREGGDMNNSNALLPYVTVEVQGHKKKALLDSGSAVNLITAEFFQKIHENCNDLKLTDSGLSVLSVNLSRQPSRGFVELNVAFQGKLIPVRFEVIDAASEEVILGAGFLAQRGIAIDCKSRTYSLSELQNVSFQWDCSDNAKLVMLQHLPRSAPSIDDFLDDKKLPVVECKIELTSAVQKSVNEILEKYAHVVTDKPGLTQVLEHKIPIDTDKPLRGRTFPMSKEKLEAFQESFQKLIDLDLIEASDSPHRSGTIMVRKPKGGYRMVHDFRTINPHIRQDAYPIKSGDEILRGLSGKKVFSCFDMKLGYHQMKIAVGDRQFTAFEGPDGALYQYKTLPMGIANGPPSFVRLTEKVLAPLLGKIVWVYFDDIVIASNSIEEHLEHLEMVFDLLAQANLTVSKEKMKLFYSRVLYVGRIVSAEGIEVNPAKIAAVENFPKPKSRAAVERFLGLIAWNQKFIPNLAKIAKPLNKLKSKNVKFDWTTECEQAFQLLKLRACSTEVLSFPRLGEPFVIFTDASDVGLGAILAQEQEGILRTIEYASYTLNEHEIRYSATHKECLAVLWSLERWRQFTEGVHVTVVTDHQALVPILSKPSSSGRLARWAIRIQDFNVTVKYRPGRENQAPDALSRAVQELSEADRIASVCLHSGTLVAQNESCALPLCKPLPKHLKEIWWIGCDGCNQWFHQHCLNITQQQAEELDFFLCPKCERDGIEPDLGLAYNFSRADLISHQKDDEDLQKIRQAVQSGSAIENVSDRFVLTKDVLYRKTNDDRLQAVVPSSLRKAVLILNHSLPTAGHLGRHKTLDRITQSAWWKGIGRSVADFVKNCSVCQRTKPVFHKPSGLMQSTTSNKVWQILAIDLVGPLPRASSNGSRYILVLEDHLSKFAQAIPLKNASASSVCKTLFCDVFCRFGGPDEVLTDNGAQFRSKMFQSLCQEWHIEQHFTSVYHPQTNFVERFNRDVKQMLKAFAGTSHTTWAVYVPQIVFAHNTAICAATGKAPATLFFGRKLFGPGDGQFRIPAEYESVNSDLRTVQSSIQKQSLTNAHYYNRKRRMQPVLSPGDKVMIKTHYKSSSAQNFAAGLAPPYDGPFVVIRQISPVAYEIMVRNVKKVVHVEQIKPIVP